MGIKVQLYYPKSQGIKGTGNSFKGGWLVDASKRGYNILLEGFIEMSNARRVKQNL